jgi:hypothetical protein
VFHGHRKQDFVGHHLILLLRPLRKREKSTRRSFTHLVYPLVDFSQLVNNINRLINLFSK